MENKKRLDLDFIITSFILVIISASSSLFWTLVITWFHIITKNSQKEFFTYIFTSILILLFLFYLKKHEN